MASAVYPSMHMCEFCLKSARSQPIWDSGSQVETDSIFQNLTPAQNSGFYRKDSNKQTILHSVVQQPVPATKIQINFGQNTFLTYILYHAYSDHITASESLIITNGCIRNSLHLPESTWLLIQSTGIEMKEC
jgi:hypothetical protein